MPIDTKAIIYDRLDDKGISGIEIAEKNAQNRDQNIIEDQFFRKSVEYVFLIEETTILED